MAYGTVNPRVTKARDVNDHTNPRVTKARDVNAHTSLSTSKRFFLLSQNGGSKKE